jgi:hypothetical protein
MKISSTTRVLKQLVSAAAFLGVAGTAVPALAHHSGFIAFETDKEMVLTGTVTEFEYVNPHSVLQVMAPGPDGRSVEWSIASMSPIVLGRAGIMRDTFQKGETVTVKAHPSMEGGLSGWLIAVTKADGMVYSVRGMDER